MALLQDLPNETLILILRFLGAFDLQSTLLAQRVNRRFRDMIQDAVLRGASSSYTQSADPQRYSSEVGRMAINPLLQRKFKGLFDSADCFTSLERARFWFLTLDGDATLPFRRLPWAAAGQPSRDVFLRPGASWRGLSPTFGMAPRTRVLDVVKSFEGDTQSPVAYFQVELPDSGLTMELLYDILLCEEALYGSDTGSWQLLFGKRFKSFDVLYRWGCFIIDEPGNSELVGEAPDAAILYVRGGDGCSETVLGEYAWMPRRLVKSCKPKFLPWQGPLIDPQETEWFQ
ncbi:hypothetical protein GGR55DRAFT_309569 [Xylaria sp. FL0064]|nr:hypothetical protein GGR55DRAFT_309569 [Xylaria sp. FL0064]